jgi:hypothetical protein
MAKKKREEFEEVEEETIPEAPAYYNRDAGKKQAGMVVKTHNDRFCLPDGCIWQYETMGGRLQLVVYRPEGDEPMLVVPADNVISILAGATLIRDTEWRV